MTTRTSLFLLSPASLNSGSALFSTPTNMKYGIVSGLQPSPAASNKAPATVRSRQELAMSRPLRGFLPAPPLPDREQNAPPQQGQRRETDHCPQHPRLEPPDPEPAPPRRPDQAPRDHPEEEHRQQRSDRVGPQRGG